jgi:hypothetical protein
MNKVDTGFPLIYRFDDVLDTESCKLIYEYTINQKINSEYSIDGRMPWFDDDHIPMTKISDNNIKNIIIKHRDVVTTLVADCFKTIVYPHFTDIVLWRTGRKMAFHKDDGYQGDTTLYVRHFTTVTYINDDYQGGETLIRNQDTTLPSGVPIDPELDVYYKSIPRTGSVAIFVSDERCEHSVNEVLSGNRLTIPIWFTTDISHKEV